MAAQKNGYLLVYVSNESNFTVYFDNLQVMHKPGPITEETHYYPFGLVISGISSKSAGTLTNKYKFGEKNYNQMSSAIIAGLKCMTSVQEITTLKLDVGIQ